MGTILTALPTELDKSNMKDAIISFPNQIEQSFFIMENWKARKEYSDINSILIIGMGGSAIGGDVARVIAQDDCSVPIIVKRWFSHTSTEEKKTDLVIQVRPTIVVDNYSGIEKKEYH